MDEGKRDEDEPYHVQKTAQDLPEEVEEGREGGAALRATRSSSTLSRGDAFGAHCVAKCIRRLRSTIAFPLSQHRCCSILRSLRFLGGLPQQRMPHRIEYLKDLLVFYRQCVSRTPL